VLKLGDPKAKRSVTVALVEEILTKRPFSRVLALLLLNSNEANPLRAAQWFDLARLARECLKSLTSEDLRQMHLLASVDPEAQVALDGYENAYSNIQAAGLEGELSKIMLRYRREGYPHIIVPSEAQPAPSFAEELNASVHSV
jgi:hypothetical protein